MDRATDWRHRAEHLRATAGKMPSSSAQANLLDAATALDQRAAAIERSRRPKRHTGRENPPPRQ